MDIIEAKEAHGGLPKAAVSETLHLSKFTFTDMHLLLLCKGFLRVRSQSADADDDDTGDLEVYSASSSTSNDRQRVCDSFRQKYPEDFNKADERLTLLAPIQKVVPTDLLEQLRNAARNKVGEVFGRGAGAALTSLFHRFVGATPQQRASVSTNAGSTASGTPQESAISSQGENSETSASSGKSQESLTSSESYGISTAATPTSSSIALFGSLWELIFLGCMLSSLYVCYQYGDRAMVRLGRRSASRKKEEEVQELAEYTVIGYPSISGRPTGDSFTGTSVAADHEGSKYIGLGAGSYDRDESPHANLI
ncbi:unnamed protein product [Amoebophrya sp. A25]|nr:unnamed protein product [Amoebophrya sp. A25]|eukprot:GSA25T00013967001.1